MMTSKTTLLNKAQQAERSVDGEYKVAVVSEITTMMSRIIRTTDASYVDQATKMALWDAYSELSRAKHRIVMSTYQAAISAYKENISLLSK